MAAQSSKGSKGDTMSALAKAKKYKLHDHFITKKAFVDMMNSLPEKVGGREGKYGLVFITIKGLDDVMMTWNCST